MAVTNVTFKIDKIKNDDYDNRWTKKFVNEWNDIYLHIDGMDMAVYDEKSDYDNPFVEPLFDLNIYKAKVRPLNDDLSVKTKAMKFVIRCDQLREKTLCVEDERDEWIEKFGRCNFAHSTRLSSLLTTIRSSMENLMSNQVSRMRTRNASAADVIDSASSS